VFVPIRLIGFGKPPVRFQLTTITMALACCYKNYVELMATLETLHGQEIIEQHKKMFLVIGEGQAKASG
jgi:hypothetical protein